MQKVLLLFAITVCCRINLLAQASESKIEYQKTEQSVAMIELPYTPTVVEDAVKDYMAKKGCKMSGSKGFSVAKATKLDSADTDLSDLYFKFEPKSHKDKDITVVTLLPTKTNVGILADSLNRASKLDPAKSFLNGIAPIVAAHNIDVQIADQEEVLKKAQKKLNGLLGDQTDLEKKIRNLNADLDQNKKDQVKQAALVQTNVNGDEDALKKAQKKVNKLLDDQGDYEKKLRKDQAVLDQNKHDQSYQQQEVDKQKQVLDAIKSKQKS